MMTLTDDQRLLQDTVRPFMAEEGAIKKQLRYWRDINCADGFGHSLWKQFLLQLQNRLKMLKQGTHRKRTILFQEVAKHCDKTNGEMNCYVRE